MSQDGLFSVKSTYNLALSLNKAHEGEGSNNDEEDIFWKGIWNLKF